MFLFRFFLIFSLFLNLLVASVIEVNGNTNALEILPLSYIYIDKTKKLNLEEVKKKEFKENKNTLLAYGYGPDFNVWTKFTIKNNTSKNISKILQYDHEITAIIEFYDENKVFKSGVLNFEKPRKTLNPIFELKFTAYEERTFYIKAASIETPLMIKLNLWENSFLYEKEINHQFYLALFFGAMIILALYNIFIFFITKDISYFWYVSYLFTIIGHQYFFVGLRFKYEASFLSNFLATQGAYLLVTTPILTLGLFSKYFLNTKQYSKINKIINFFLITIPISVFYGMIFGNTPAFQNLYYIIFVFFIFFTACYGAYKKNKQAYFVLAGWLALFISWTLMYLSSLGIFQIYKYNNYLVEIGILSEALIFSFALAHRIKTLQKEKILANNRLISQQTSEKQRLAIEVENKTKDLIQTLDEKHNLLKEKDLLFKELHHRVKNNMQMVVSMLRLQSSDLKDNNTKQVFNEAQNRINTMAYLHELLYKQDNITHINTYEYFSLLIDQLIESSIKDIKIKYDIKANLKMEQAIYCGLILNELISNSIKYAFEKSGVIEVYLKKDENTYILEVSDNGKGFDKNKKTNSLGLILIDSLAKNS